MKGLEGKVALVTGGHADRRGRGASAEVTIVSNRTPDDIGAGKVMSSPCMFDASLQIERDLGLHPWAAGCPPVQGIDLTVPHPGQPGAQAIDWAHRLDKTAQAVDQRLKMPVWSAGYPTKHLTGGFCLNSGAAPRSARRAKCSRRRSWMARATADLLRLCFAPRSMALNGVRSRP